MRNGKCDPKEYYNKVSSLFLSLLLFAHAPDWQVHAGKRVAGVMAVGPAKGDSKISESIFPLSGSVVHFSNFTVVAALQASM